MSKKSVREFITQKGLIPSIHTGLSRSSVTEENNVENVVLKQLGITKKTLKKMRLGELKILLLMLHDATTLLVEELGKRNG